VPRVYGTGDMKLHLENEKEVQLARKLGLKVKEIRTTFYGVPFYEVGLNDDEDIKRFLEAYYKLPLVTIEQWEDDTPSEFYELPEKLGGVLRGHHLRVWILGNFTKEQWRKAVQELNKRILERDRTCRYCGKRFPEAYLRFKHEKTCRKK